MKKLIALSLLASVSALPLFAESPSFNFVEGGYTEFEDFDGFQLRGNVEINPNFFINADYQGLSVDDGGITNDLDMAFIGLGYKFDTSSSTSIYTMLNYADLSASNVFESFNDDGFQLAVGARTQISNLTQLYGEIATTDYDELGGRTELKLGLRQKITDDLGAYAEYKRDDFSDDGFSLGLTWQF